MKYLGILLIAFSFVECASVKFTKSPPFEITEATYQNWVGGLPGVHGTLISITYESEKEISFDSIYFRNRIGKLEANNIKGKQRITGTLNKFSFGEKKDLILHSDPKKEFENELPITQKAIFELEENEAVISYIVGEKTKYFKILNVEEGKPIFRQ